MKKSFCLAICSLLFALVWARNADADLILDGTFSTLTSSTTTQYTFGQWGNNSGSATGSVITIADWDTAGYNFVYTAATASSGTQASGANSGRAHEAPGQSNVGGYGNTYLFGSGDGTANSGNGGLKSFATSLFTGNFIGADGAYEQGAITQTITGLQVGHAYALTFYWGGAQQEGATFTSATSEYWTVSLGGQSQTTGTVNVNNKDFSGWIKQTFNYTATSTSETLSFLAGGTPTGQPPFALLGGVSLNPVPEPASWTYFAALGAVTICVTVSRRRRAACANESSL